MDKLLTANEIIKELKISRSTLNRWLKQGLPVCRINGSMRFIDVDVMKWLRESGR
jgi:predicted site-specific integrase-resolvase